MTTLQSHYHCTFMRIFVYILHRRWHGSRRIRRREKPFIALKGNGTSQQAGKDSCVVYTANPLSAFTY